MPKTILILGGSYSGASIAHYLLKHAIPALPTPTDYQLVLVSPSREIICRPAAPRALIADSFFDQSKLFVNLEENFKQYGARFKYIHGRATGLDHEGRSVTVSLVEDGSEEVKIAYHALVIATGASTPSPLLSLNGSGRDSLKKEWELFRSALRTAKSIVIAGGGAAGIETAGELGEHLNGRAGWFSQTLDNPKVKITVVAAGKEILPLLRPSIAQKGEAHLAKVGVNVIKNTRVDSVVPAESGRTGGDNLTAKTDVKLSDGQTLQADLYIPAYGTTPNTGFVDQSLRVPDGRVDTNPQTLRVDKAGERVYAIGDASSYARPAIHIITEAVPVLGSNIKRDLLLAAGQTPGEDRVFKADESETHLVPIGRSKGVGAAMGWKMPSFFVWLIKGRDYWLWTTTKLWSGQQWAKEL